MKLKKIFSRVMAVLTAVIFLFGLTVFICVLKANSGEVPNVFGFSVMRIQTGSMVPEYEVGTIIVTKKTDPETLRTGDVISFYSSTAEISNQVNTHRIIDISYLPGGEKVFTTKGDANDMPDDAQVLAKNVIGKVVVNIGVFSGSVISVLQNRTVIFFLIILPLIFITFSEAVHLVNLFMDSREESKEEEADGKNGEDKN